MGSLNVNRRLFKRSAGISFIALIALITLLVATGSVFAASPIAGVGGFTISASSITGSDFELIPNLTSTNTGGGNGGNVTQAYPQNVLSLRNQYQKTYPAAMVYLGEANIDGLDLYKNISLAAITSQFGINNVDYVKVEITAADDVEGTNLLLNATDIAADSAKFTSMNMMENLPTKHPNHLTAIQQDPNLTQGIFGRLASDPGFAPANLTVTDDEINTGVQIGLSATSMVLSKGVINTHSMKAAAMTIPGMKLQLHLFNTSDEHIQAPYGSNHAQTYDDMPYDAGLGKTLNDGNQP